MIFRFLSESDEALQASVSNRIIIYLLTDSTLTPAHDDPSPSQQQPAHLLPYTRINTYSELFWILNSEFGISSYLRRLEVCRRRWARPRSWRSCWRATWARPPPPSASTPTRGGGGTSHFARLIRTASQLQAYSAPVTRNKENIIVKLAPCPLCSVTATTTWGSTHQSSTSSISAVTCRSVNVRSLQVWWLLSLIYQSVVNLS